MTQTRSSSPCEPLRAAVALAAVLTLGAGASPTAIATQDGGPEMAIEQDGEPRLEADQNGNESAQNGNDRTDRTGDWLDRPEELEEALDKWADQYVRYLITPEEKRIYESLESPERRLAFIERFWELRDPTPGTPENEYRDDHLERFATATRLFAAGKPGWATDRGRIYILLGPPNQIQRNPTGRGPMERASETWTYNGIDNPQLPASVDLDFVDFHGTGEFELVSDLDTTAPIWSEQFGYVHSNLDAYALRRHADRLYDERLGIDRFRDPTAIGRDYLDFFRTVREIDRVPEIHLERLASLRESVEADVSFGAGGVEEEVAFFGGEGNASVVDVTLALAYDELRSTGVSGQRHYSVDLYAALRDGGTTVAEQERRLNFRLAPEEWERLRDKRILQSLELTAPPGDYELLLLTRDNTTGAIRQDAFPVEVPDLRPSTLKLSSLTLASHVERARGGDGASSAQAAFQRGDLVVVPNVGGAYGPGQNLLLYVQAYGLALDEDGSNRVSIRGRIWRDGKPFRAIPAQHPYPAPQDRMAFTLGVALSGFEPGSYTATVTVVDEVAGVEASVSAPFEVSDGRPAARRR